jgi:hypothetical protein
VKLNIVLLLASVALFEVATAQPGSVYFRVITVGGDANRWTGAFEISDLSQTIAATDAVALSTSFVGGLSSEPGFTRTSGSDIFYWQGDNDPPSANSTIYSLDLVTAVKAGITWGGLFDQSFDLLSGVTTDLSVLNPVFIRVSGQDGIIHFSDEPFPVVDYYSEWLTNYPSLSDTSRLADPDKDGFNNETEFALDGDPTQATPDLIQVAGDESQVLFTFVAHNELFPGSYAILASTNLLEVPFATDRSVTVSDSPDQSGVLLTDTYTRRQFSGPADVGTKFFRVRAFFP